MIALLSALSRLVCRFPAATLVVAVVLTAALAALSTRVEVAVGMDEFAPDNVHLDAADTLGERFGAAGEEVLQVVVAAEAGGELISADGLHAVADVSAALTDGDAAEHLVAVPDQPPVASPFGPTLHALEQQGVPLETVDDDTVRTAFLASLEELSGQDAAAIEMLLPDDTDLATPSADAALLLAFVSAEQLPTDGVERLDAMIDVQLELAEAAEEAALSTDYSVSAFGFPLLFSDTETFEAELARLFATAFAVIVLILATVYWVRPEAALRPIAAGRRTVADVLLTMATIVMAVTWMNGAAALLGPEFLAVIGPLTEPTQIIPVLLIGLGVDYAIHLTSRYREEVGRDASVSVALARAMRTVGLALGLATVTTALGFLTNVFNPVPTMRDFGVLAAVGIVSAFVLMLTFVPAARLLLDRRAERTGRLPGPALRHTSRRLLPETMARTAALAERGPVATLAVTVALGGTLGFWGLSQLETRFSATDFVAPDNPILAALDDIEDRFGGGFGETTEVLVTGDVARPGVHDALIDATERLAEVEQVTTADGRAVVESPASVLAALVAPGFDGAPAAPDVAALAAAEGLGEDLRFPAGADVAAVYAAMGEAAPLEAERVLDVVDGRVAHARVGIQTSGGEDAAGDVLAALDAAFAPLEAAGADVVVTSNPIINHTIVLALQDAQVDSLLTTLGAVLVLLAVSFWLRNRRPALGVLTTLPVVLALLWTFAMMAATGIPFGPITSTIAALAIGIGIPYAIHITNRFEEERRRLPTDAAIRSTVRHTGGALAGSALTTCAGFGVLLTSTLTPFQQFGAVTVYAIGLALLATTLVLPSALTLWDRWHRRRGDAAATADRDRQDDRPDEPGQAEPRTSRVRSLLKRAALVVGVVALVVVLGVAAWLAPLIFDRDYPQPVADPAPLEPTGHVDVGDAQLPHLGEGAAIVNSASVAAYQGKPVLINYSATKGAIVSLTRALAASLTEDGVRVNAVAPGPVWTPLIPASFEAQETAAFGGTTPMGRPGEPDEIAPSYLFLASEDGAYMSGQVLHPNGGQIVGGSSETTWPQGPPTRRVTSTRSATASDPAPLRRSRAWRAWPWPPWASSPTGPRDTPSPCRRDRQIRSPARPRGRWDCS